MVLVMWTVGNNHEISVPLENAKGYVFSMFGKNLPFYDSNDGSYIEISNNPIYLIVEGEENE